MHNYLHLISLLFYHLIITYALYSLLKILSIKIISIYLDQCKKLEEEAKLLRPLPEKMEKFRQLEAKLNGEKHQLEGN